MVILHIKSENKKFLPMIILIQMVLKNTSKKIIFKQNKKLKISLNNNKNIKILQKKVTVPLEILKILKIIFIMKFQVQNINLIIMDLLITQSI